MLSKAKAASFLSVNAGRILEMGERGDLTVVILDDYRKYVVGQEGIVTTSPTAKSGRVPSGIVTAGKVDRVTGSDPQS